MRHERFMRHHKHWHRPRRVGRFLFLRFAVTFGFMTLLLIGGMVALAFFITHVLGGEGQPGRFGVFGLALLLPLLAGGIAMWAFRSIADPLANVMNAANAVADGDLSAQVPVSEHAPREFKKLAHSFNRMARELERSDRLRRNLTADVAHELRTPLHIIQGNLEGILDGIYEPTTKQISTMLDEIRSLTRLVEDLQTLSLAEAGQLPLIWEQVDVTELLADVGTSFSGQVEAAEIILNIETNGDPLQMTITADMGRLDQALSNLMANAIRHTPAGGIITLQAEPIHEGVRITVADTGEGIPPEDLSYIFDRFWRGDRSRSHVDGVGSGLGLAITRQLIHAHNGRIKAESEPGTGTIFTIELPASLKPSDTE